jgi:hypothetical protein
MLLDTLHSTKGYFVRLQSYVQIMKKIRNLLTNQTESRAISARISAQETVFGQASSNLAFTLSTEPYPRRVKLGGASFSALFPCVESSKTEPSQPYTRKI